LVAAGVVWYLGWRAVAAQLAAASPALVVLIALTEAATEWIRALKWRLVLGPGKQAVALFFISKAGGNFSPGRVGELLPLVFKAYRTPQLGAWILLDRILEASSTVFFALAGLAALEFFPPWVAVGQGIALAAAAVVGIYALTHPALLGRMARGPSESGIVGRLARFAVEAGAELRAMGRKMPMVLLLTVVPSLLDLAVYSLVFASLGYRLSWALAAGAKCVHGLMTVIPVTPHLTGIPHLTSAWLLNRVGGLAPDVLAAAALLREALVNGVFWTSFAIGVAGWRNRRQTGQV